MIRERKSERKISFLSGEVINKTMKELNEIEFTVGGTLNLYEVSLLRLCGFSEF
jgi:hypothetical protein